MKNLILMALLLAGCSALNKGLNLKRSIASFKLQESVDFKIELSEETLFANGANSVFLKVGVLSGQDINPKDLKLISDAPLKKSEFILKDGNYIIKLTPPVKSDDIKIFVSWNDQPSSVVVLKTTLSPIRETMLPHKSTGNTMMWVSGLTYSREDYMPADQFEGFTIENRGKNSIVSAQESMRDFQFGYEQQARQNISLMISDAPNSTVSHTMHSHFAFFPRKYLPFALINSKKEVTVTLPTGEQMMFAENGEVIDGVFEEGPVDNSLDRFKRTYPNLKYQGKGILLRANARGQMPQQGQFEATKIDMEYGLKYSSDVLIINGTTGQRCRRPKIDFWSNADVTPILFKFPTDKELDTYLKAKCNFGIPELEDIAATVPENHLEISKDIWSKCFSGTGMKECLALEMSDVEDDLLKSKIEFDLEQKYIREKKAESLNVIAALKEEVRGIRTTLLSEATWVENQSCLEKSKSLVVSKFHFHDIQALIKNELIQNCSTIASEMESIASFDIKGLKEEIESNFDWVKISTKERFTTDCLQVGISKLTSANRYYASPNIYLNPLRLLCLEIESSSAFNSWLKTQTASLKEQVSSSALIVLEALADKRAAACVAQYPIDSQLNRIRFKRARENCLIENWSVLEDEALKEAKKDPMVIRVDLDLEIIRTELSAESRRLQLKLMKKYFL